MSTDRTKPGKQGKLGKRDRKRKREFDYGRFHSRHVALRVAYIGARYHGFASQGPDDPGGTIEAQLFAAFTKGCLVEDRTTANYSRCGRTDKGVSAFGQVISLDLRSALNAEQGADVRGFVPKDTAPKVLRTDGDGDGDGAATAKASSKKKENVELDYVNIMNRLLPDDIRVTAWAPIQTDFSARFSCSYRCYKYYFLQENMDIDKMREAGAKMLGEHDFRNLCKMDIGGGVTTFMRNILEFSIDRMHPSPAPAAGSPPALTDPHYTMWVINVKGMAFLWHQIRCIAAILFMVGRGHEEPSVVDALLNIEAHPTKPQYEMASDLPLVLFDCGYKQIDWIFSAETHSRVHADLYRMWKNLAIKSAMIESMLGDLDASLVPVDQKPLQSWSDRGIKHVARRSHIPLLQRQTGETLETKLAAQEAKDERKRVAAEAAEAAAGLESAPADE